MSTGGAIPPAFVPPCISKGARSVRGVGQAGGFSLAPNVRGVGRAGGLPPTKMKVVAGLASNMVGENLEALIHARCKRVDGMAKVSTFQRA